MVKNTDYGYYSKLLSKPFDTVDELVAAEAEYKKAHEAEEKAKAEKKARADEIQAAYSAYLAAYEAAEKRIKEVSKEENDKVRGAYKKYEELKAKFIKDYNSYHMTYTNKNGEKAVSISDLFEEMFNSMPDIFHW